MRIHSMEQVMMIIVGGCWHGNSCAWCRGWLPRSCHKALLNHTGNQWLRDLAAREETTRHPARKQRCKVGGVLGRCGLQGLKQPSTTSEAFCNL